MEKDKILRHIKQEEIDYGHSYHHRFRGGF